MLTHARIFNAIDLYRGDEFWLYDYIFKTWRVAEQNQDYLIAENVHYPLDKIKIEHGTGVVYSSLHYQEYDISGVANTFDNWKITDYRNLIALETPYGSL